MEGNDNSASSRSFRHRVFSASIISMLKQDARKESVTPDNTHNQSSITDPNASRTESSNNSSPPSPKQDNIDGVTSNLPLVAGDPEKAGQQPDTTFNGKGDPFAGGVEGGVDYKTMVWWHAGMVMVAETISLGILSLPMSMATLGIIPGLVLLIGLGIMATYSGYVIGQFKNAYPHIHSFADAGEVLFGKFGGEFLGAAQLLFFVFIMGSHILTFSVAMNVLTNHSTCTIVFMVAGTIISLLCTLPRTLKHLSYYSVASFISIIGAVLITMICVGREKPAMQRLEFKVVTDISLWPRPGIQFYEAFLAMTNMVFAYAGHVAFFSFISELKDPRDFPKALAFLQISDISMYIITAVVIYYYAGSKVASPALNSASSLWMKIAYGVAMPTIIIAGVVNGHVAVKYLYVRMLRNNKEDIMHQKSFKAIGLWIAICSVLWFLAWIIAEGVPVFNDLLGITSALFASWFTFGFSGIFWFRMNLKRGDEWYMVVVPRENWTWKKTVLAGVNILNIITAIILCFIGLYASGQSIKNNSVENKPFSCKSVGSSKPEN